MDLDLVRHALAAARRHGYAEVELGEGEASFTARLAKGAKPKAAPSAGPSAAPTAEAGPKDVRSTLVGYYRAPKEPLEVGRTIRKGDPVGMVEALGIVTEVTSKVEGEIVEVLVEPGQAVEYGQPLARVRG